MHIAASASRKIAVLFRAFLSSSLQFSEGSSGLNVVLGTSQQCYHCGLLWGSFKQQEVAPSQHSPVCAPSTWSACLGSWPVPQEGDGDPGSTSRVSHQHE